MNHSGLNIKEIKSRNISSILYLLNSNQPMSRKDIADSLSLTPAAVTKICAKMIEDGLIEEKGEEKSNGAGRKKILLSLKLQSFYTLCINAEVDKITISAVRLDAKLINSISLDVSADIDEIISESKKVLNESKIEKSKFLCTSICVIGSAENSGFGIWNNDEIKNAAEKEIGLPVVLENNVKAFALAQLIYSKKTYEKSVLFFKWGPGIGSAIANDGKVLSGSDADITEIGHYIIKKDGIKCRCGRYGCLETEASAMAIKNAAGQDMALNEIINSTDKNIINIIDEKIDLVAMALTNTATILNAEKIILFGSVFTNTQISQKTAKQCNRYNSNLKEDTVECSKLNDKISYIGPAALAAKHFFFEKH